MKQKILLIPISIMLLLIILGYTNCNDMDYATVTLNINRNDISSLQNRIYKRSIIDSILEFFSTPAYAFSPNWDSERTGALTLSIRGENIQTSTYDIPYGVTSYTIRLLSGVKTIEITALYAGKKNWGAHTTKNLKGGTSTNISMNMIPMTAINSTGSLSGNVNLNIDGMNSAAYSTDFNIYRSTNLNGPYSLIDTILVTNNSYVDTTPGTIGTTVYYKLSVIGSLGEGVLCDAESQIINP